MFVSSIWPPIVIEIKQHIQKRINCSSPFMYAVDTDALSPKALFPWTDVQNNSLWQIVILIIM